MVSGPLKFTLLKFLNAIASINALIWQIRWRLRPRNPSVRVNLGCGTNYLEEWINIDLNPRQKVDMWLDICRPLPFRSGEVKNIYLSHVLEHLTKKEMIGVLRECHRILRSGGGIRIVVPSLEKSINAYVEKDFNFFYGSGKSIGRRFSDWLLCEGNHLHAFDFGYLEEVLTDAGFKDVIRTRGGFTQVLNKQSMHKLQENDKTSLFVECVRK